jgi:uncharacterized coiled-coil protein SlyX
MKENGAIAIIRPPDRAHIRTNLPGMGRQPPCDIRQIDCRYPRYVIERRSYGRDSIVEVEYPHENARGFWATMQSHQRLIIPAASAFVFVVAGLSLVRGFGGTMEAPSSSVAHVPTVEQVSNEILETAKGLGLTQQQAVDQLQVVQDQLVAQKAETKKLAEQIATLTERLDALQQTVANPPAVSTRAATTGPQTKPR